MNRKLLKNIVIILLAILAVFAVARIVMKIVQGGRKGERLVFSVGSQVLKKQSVDVLISFEGIVQGDPQVKVYPQVSGKFQGNAVQEGAFVQQGSTLAFINRDIVGADYLYSPVRSPISGMVTKLYFIDKGAAITPDKAIAEVANIQNVKMVISAGQDDLVKVKKDQKAVIRSKGGETNFLEGSVYSVAPFIDSDTLSGGIVIKAVNRNNLMKVGMSVSVDISIGKREMFLVPESSIIMGLDRVYIYVNNDGKARQVEVVRGYTKNEMVEISGDFREGDLLITDGNFKLNNGVSIRIISTNGISALTAPANVTNQKMPANAVATNGNVPLLTNRKAQADTTVTNIKAPVLTNQARKPANRK